MQIDKHDEAIFPLSNGILKCCNQFPRRYANIDEMTRQLPEISKLGFNAVWINPIQLTGRQQKRFGNKHGSLYAIADHWRVDPDFSVVKYKEEGTPEHGTQHEAFNKEKKAMLKYTDTARKEGLIPIFDLVLLHAAIDSPLLTNKHPRFKGKIDTAHWFKRHPNGNSVVMGLDEHGNQYGDKLWDDVAQFNYDNPKVTDEIFRYLWEPYIDMYVGELGFQGIRIDALSSIPPKIVKRIIHYLTEKCEEVHGVKPIIIGESFGSSDEIKDHFKGLGITHITNLAYWAPTVTGPNISWDKKTDCRQMWEGDGAWYMDHMGKQQQIVYLSPDGKIIPGKKGGTIGCSSFHDADPWSRKLVNAGITEPADIGRGMREKIAIAAFTSDAGWFMPAGEMDADSRRYHVFRDKNVKEPEPHCNLRPFIAGVNQILSMLPVTQFGGWAKRCFLNNEPDLMIVFRNSGYGDSGEKSVILINTNPQKEIQLSSTNIVDLAQLIGHGYSSMDFAQPEKHRIFCCGGVQLFHNRSAEQFAPVPKQPFSAAIPPSSLLR